MPHPYVTKVTLNERQIVLTVELDHSMSGLPIEISGYATQNGGAFAYFYDVQTADPEPDGTVVMWVKATPFHGFKDGEDVTVVLRAARVWVTVLKKTPHGEMPVTHEAAQADNSPGAQDGTMWDSIRAVGWQAPGGPVPSWNPTPASAGGASFHGS